MMYGLKRILSSLLVVIMVFATLTVAPLTVNAINFTPRTTAPDSGNSYYYSNNPFYNNGYGMPNCTCYAYGRAYELLGSKPNLSTKNAGYWWWYNKNNGIYSYGSTPKLGAIACWDKYDQNQGHVAVVESIDGNSVTISESHYKSTFFDTRTIVSNSSNYLTSMRFLGYIYIGDFNTEPPTNVSLSKNQYWYDIKDTITLYPNANNATSYWLSVYKDNNHIIDQAINGEFSFQASQWGYGDYYAWITAVNSAGGTDSEGINFTVCGAPSYSGISTSKAFYDWDENETVEITVNSICAKGQVIGIDFLDENLNCVKRIVTDNSDMTYRISAKSLGIGYFSAYFSVFNGSGSIDTERVKFYIGQKKDIGSDFCAKIKNNSSNKYLTVNNDNVEGQDNKDSNNQVWHFIKLSDGSYKIRKYNDKKALDVDNYASSGPGSNVHVYNDWDTTAQKFNIYEVCGAYYIKPVCTDMVLDMSQSTYNLEVWGSSFDWHPQKFSIEKLSPGNPLIALNKTKFTLDENIIVNVSAEYLVQYYNVQVYKQDKLIYTKKLTSNTINIPTSELGTGDYTVLVSCTNINGTTNTEKINFCIIDNATTVTVKPTTITTTTKPTTVTVKPTTVTTTTKPTTVTTNPTKKEFVISSLLLNVTTDNVEKKIVEGNKYTATLKPEKDYKLDSVKIKMGDAEITVPFTDDNCTINIPNVNGDISIIAVATKIPEPTTVTIEPTTATTKPTTVTTEPTTVPQKNKYKVSSMFVNVVSDKAYSHVIEGDTYSVTLTPDIGYKLENIKVKMGDKDITVPFTDSECTINIPNVDGDIVIIAVATKMLEPTTVTTEPTTAATKPTTVTTEPTTVPQKNKYKVSSMFVNVVSDKAYGHVIEGDTYSATLTPEIGYKLENIKVKMGDKDITVPFTDDNCTINIPNVNGDIVIIAVATKIPEPTTVTIEPTTATTEPTTATTTNPTKPEVKKVTNVALSKKLVTLVNGKSMVVKATVTPNDATNKKVKWTTSNSKVATVNASGKITAKGKGVATIKVMALDGSMKYATLKVTVKQPVTSVKLNKKSANLKVKGKANQKTVTLKATVSPKNANNKAVTWSTSNKKIATVNSKGKVTAKKKGTCYITATAKDGSNKSAKCKIIIK